MYYYESEVGKLPDFENFPPTERSKSIRNRHVVDFLQQTVNLHITVCLKYRYGLKVCVILLSQISLSKGS